MIEAVDAKCYEIPGTPYTAFISAQRCDRVWAPVYRQRRGCQKLKIYSRKALDPIFSQNTPCSAMTTFLAWKHRALKNDTITPLSTIKALHERHTAPRRKTAGCNVKYGQNTTRPKKEAERRANSYAGERPKKGNTRLIQVADVKRLREILRATNRHRATIGSGLPLDSAMQGSFIYNINTQTTLLFKGSLRARKISATKNKIRFFFSCNTFSGILFTFA